MADTERFETDLPVDLAAYVRARAGQGDLGTDGDVLREAVRALQQRDAKLDEMRAMIQESLADPGTPLTDEEVAAHFRRREREWLSRGGHA